MKLPFNMVLNPMIRPYFGESRQFCKQPMFSMSVVYMYAYGALGFLINVNHIRKHLGEIPQDATNRSVSRDTMLIRDIKIIACSMGVIQYSCLLLGCFSENPALFLPHFTGQFILFLSKIIYIITLLARLSWANAKEIRNSLGSLIIMGFNWLQELGKVNNESPEGVRMRLRTLLVALLGVSMSACAFASQPVELELDDDEVSQRLSNVSFARRITKPTIRLVMGYGKLSAFITAGSSLLLLIAVMSKQSWWRRGARWLAAPALLVAALEAASDAGDAMLAAALRGASEPARVVAQTAAAAVLITVEILVWYFIAKFFEYNPPPLPQENEKENALNILPQ